MSGAAALAAGLHAAALLVLAAAVPGCRCSAEAPAPAASASPLTSARPYGSAPLRARIGRPAGAALPSGAAAAAALSKAEAVATGRRLARAVPAACQEDGCRLNTCTAECSSWVTHLPPGALPSPRAAQDTRFACIDGCLVASREASGGAPAPSGNAPPSAPAPG